MMKISSSTSLLIVFALFCLNTIFVSSFCPTSIFCNDQVRHVQDIERNQLLRCSVVNGHNGNKEWSIADDWNSLSSETPENAIEKQKRHASMGVEKMAAQLTEKTPPKPLSKEEIWVRDVVDEIHNPVEVSPVPLYDTERTNDFESYTKTVSYEDEMGREISMLVRCNEIPQGMLVEDGRALLPLTQEEKDDVSQLVDVETLQATDFLKEAVKQMFQKHANQMVTIGGTDDNSNNNDNSSKNKSKNKSNQVKAMDATGVANWMTKCLGQEDKATVHDARVLKLIAMYGSYGTGRLLQDEFIHLYLDTIVGKGPKSFPSTKAYWKSRQKYIDMVWRDLRRHDIYGPVEAERHLLQLELDAKRKDIQQKVATAAASIQGGGGGDDFESMDECEILNWDASAQQLTITPDLTNTSLDKEELLSKSSHQRVILASDKKTPVYLKDGDFVFIDEESCIGCLQCTNVASSAFLMMDSGRARTYSQRSSAEVEQAVQACPVNCMHRVTFTELKEYETVRDSGHENHRHRRSGHIPLHVANRESDENRRTSWYHTMKQNCRSSGNCPQKGCYECPSYNQPGENPYFKQNQQRAIHMRAKYFMDNGTANVFRKTVDL